MKKTVLFFLGLVLSVAMGVTGLAWAQGTLGRPVPAGPQPAQPAEPPSAQQLLKTPAKKVFVTSQIYTGNLGGLPGAEFMCQQLARNAGLPGIYKTWLSSPGPQGLPIGPQTTFTHSTGAYVRVDGVMIALNWTYLVTKPLLTSISLDERGTFVGSSSNVYVWTGIKLGNPSEYPLAYLEHNPPPLKETPGCNNWLTSSSTSRAIVGNLTTYYMGGQWTSSEPLGTCDKSARLYCFEQ